MRTLIFIAALCAMFGADLMPGIALAQEGTPDSKPADKAEGKSKEKHKKKEKDAAAADETAADAGDAKDKDSKDKDSGDTKEASDKDMPEAKYVDDSFAGDRRIKLLMYDEADVYTITTRYGYQTNIVFAPQEEIELISVGDRSMWQIIPSGNRMFIRPMDEDVTTNMTVLTNKHSYQFDLKSVAGDKTTGNIYVAKFVYPDHKKDAPSFAAPQYSGVPAMAPAPAQMPAAMAPAPEPVAPPVVQSAAPPGNSPFGVGPSVPNAPAPGPAGSGSAPAPAAAQTSQLPPGAWQPAPNEPAVAAAPQPAPATEPVSVQAPVQAAAPQAQPVYPNYSYTYAGPDEQAPLQVYDDGKYTYLKYREVQKPLPEIFVVDRAGKESPVHYNVKGDFVVVDTVAGEIALKRGANTVYIYNEVLNPG